MLYTSAAYTLTRALKPVLKINVLCFDRGANATRHAVTAAQILDCGMHLHPTYDYCDAINAANDVGRAADLAKECAEICRAPYLGSAPDCLFVTT